MTPVEVPLVDPPHARTIRPSLDLTDCHSRVDRADGVCGVVELEGQSCTGEVLQGNPDGVEQGDLQLVGPAGGEAGSSRLYGDTEASD